MSDPELIILSDLIASSSKHANMEMTGCDLPLEIRRVRCAPGKVVEQRECHPALLTRTERTQGSELTVRTVVQMQTRRRKEESSRDYTIPERSRKRTAEPREIQEAEASSKSTRQWESPGLSVIRDKKADAHKQKDGTEPPPPNTHTHHTCKTNLNWSREHGNN